MKEVVRKMLKIAGIIILIPVALIILFLILATFAEMVPKNYTKEVKTGGNIEAKYLNYGQYEVKDIKLTGSEEVTKNFYLYYPSELETKDKKYPVVVMLNGTGVLPNKYTTLFKHLASWGFVVIGNDDGSSGFAKSADETIELINRENDNKDGVFYNKLDLNNIGITGHSQGGAGVLTTISIMDKKDAYKTAVALSSTQIESAHQYGWRYDLSKVKIPIMILAGTSGDFETKMVLPIEVMNAMYDAINAPKVMARRIGADHGQMLYSADGYVTAWFMYYLQGDESAKEMFDEIKNSKLYQDQRINLSNT